MQHTWSRGVGYAVVFETISQVYGRVSCVSSVVVAMVARCW